MNDDSNKNIVSLDEILGSGDRLNFIILAYRAGWWVTKPQDKVFLNDFFPEYKLREEDRLNYVDPQEPSILIGIFKSIWRRLKIF